MTVRHQAHRACVVVRTYPVTAFFILTCATLAAGIDANLYALVPILAVSLVVTMHVVRRMWSPPIVIAIQPDRGQVILPTQSRAPSIERHRHARH